MSGKRLRIRARVKVSEVNFDFLAGQEVGKKEGYAAGVKNTKIDADRAHLLLLRTITGLEQKVDAQKAKLQEQSYLVLDAKRATEIVRNKMVDLELKLAQNKTVPPASDWLHLPPFMLAKDEPWTVHRALKKRDRFATMYGSPVTGYTPQRLPMGVTNAEGGFLSPDFSHRFMEQIFNGPPILGAGRNVPMRLPQSYAEGGLIRSLRPPGDPVFHWDGAREEAEDGQAMTELTNMSEHNLDAVRMAFRHPFELSSEFRTPEAEEGVRQASAEGGVTNVAAGHSHSIDLDIRVDDSQMQDAIQRIAALSGVRANAVVSTEEFERAMVRILNLERTMGVEAPEEESAGEENVDAGDRSGSQGGEHS